MPAQVEERLRDAFRAAAEAITARDLPGPPTPRDRSWVARRLPEWTPRARVRAVIPVVAAACVAVIVVAATLVAPRVLFSTGHLILVTTAQPPVMDGAQPSAAW